MSRKLSLDEIVKPRMWIAGDQATERAILDEKDQQYLIEYLRTAPEDVGIYEHSRPTKTCQEKVDLLNQESGRPWDLHQAIRAVYFKHGAVKHDAALLHVFVTPDLGRRIPTEPCAGKYLMPAPAHLLPYSMEQGTCTPFVHDWDISQAAGRVQHIYFHQKPEFAQMLADFSIGGRGFEAQRYSLWIPYSDAYALLRRTFGDMVTMQDMYAPPAKSKHERSKSFKPTPDKVEA
jgi:hypothetical protein